MTLRKKLSPRECDIAVLLSTGMSHQEIATRLGLTYRTVTEYFHRMTNKFSGERVNRTNVAVWAERMMNSCPGLDDQEQIQALRRAKANLL